MTIHQQKAQKKRRNETVSCSLIGQTLSTITRRRQPFNARRGDRQIDPAGGGGLMIAGGAGLPENCVVLLPSIYACHSY